MPRKFRWIGPGVLKEDHPDHGVIIHKPGKLVTDHSLPDSRVDYFISTGVAELYKLEDGQVVSLDLDGKKLDEATPVDKMTDAEVSNAQATHEATAEEVAALQALAKPQTEAPVVAAPAAPATGAGPK